MHVREVSVWDIVSKEIAMKKLYILSLLLSVLAFASCQDLKTEPTAPSVTTDFAESVTSTSAVLNGSYSSMYLRTSGDLYCYFAISESQSDLESYSYIEDGESAYEVSVISAEISTLSAESHASRYVELNGLSPDTEYYYIFALVFKGAEVKGKIRSFTTDNAPPKLTRFDIDMEGGYYDDGYVHYRMYAEMDRSLLHYANGKECGIYVKLLDGKYIQYLPCTESGEEFSLTASVPKSLFTLYPGLHNSYASTNAMEFGVYIKSGGSYQILYSEQFYGFEYTRQPAIKITYLDQKSDEYYYEDGYDRKADYEYNYVVSGALFMNDLRTCYVGNWASEDYYHEDIADATYSRSTGILYNETTDQVNYIQFKATLCDYTEIVSSNSMAFDIYGGNCYIYLYSGTVAMASSIKAASPIYCTSIENYYL